MNKENKTKKKFMEIYESSKLNESKYDKYLTIKNKDDIIGVTISSFNLPITYKQSRIEYNVSIIEDDGKGAYDSSNFFTRDYEEAKKVSQEWSKKFKVSIENYVKGK